MTKRRVLVVGYPKSGNTWLTRLTAELPARWEKLSGGTYRRRLMELIVRL